jgi:hypothetical protein
MSAATTGERTVRDLVVSVRSKNAGPFSVTFDLFFGDADTFHEVVRSGALTPQTIAPRYNLPESDVRVFPFEPALAIKVAIPRIVAGGSPGDRDVAGGQQFVPLLALPVPAAGRP